MRLIVLVALFFSSAHAQTNKELQEQINALAEQLEAFKVGKKVPEDSFFGLGTAASKVYNVDSGTTIGGYGELLLTSPMNENESGNNVSNTTEGEFLRNILYIGHKFNDKWILNTEIEMEHVDEIFVEFAWIDYLHSESFNFRTGLVLLPMGLVNELHEPIFFDTANRPEIESKIIPSTWRELGTGVFGTIDKLTYKVFLVNGLDASGFNSDGLRGGRKKGGVKENASSVSFSTRLDYQATSDFNFGLAFYTGSSSSTSTSPTVGTSIYQAHFNYKYESWYVKGLYVTAQLDDVEAFNAATSNDLAEEMDGYYVDAGYNFYFGKKTLTPFFRYETYDTHKTLVGGVAEDLSKDRTNITVGVAFKPIPKIVYKLDYTQRTNELETGVDEINFALGYIF